MIVEATAPTRVDLAGGTLDIWPLYLFHRGAVTVNLAIDRRAWCRVETGVVGVRLESRDAGLLVEGGDVDEVLNGGGLPLVGYVLRALAVETGIRVVTESRVPAGSGLGGSSALAVAVAGAVSLASGRPLEIEDLWPLVRDAEAQCIGVPTGVQDYLAALHGGVLGVHLQPGGVRVEHLAVEREALERRLLLVDVGNTRFSGINNWGVFKGQIDGLPAVHEGLSAIAVAAGQVRAALAAGQLDPVPALLGQEWEARKRLAPGVTTPEIDRISEIAVRLGGAAKVCGAGGGGSVVVWCLEQRRTQTKSALAEAGFAVIPFRVDETGLSVNPV